MQEDSHKLRFRNLDYALISFLITVALLVAHTPLYPYVGGVLLVMIAIAVLFFLRKNSTARIFLFLFLGGISAFLFVALFVHTPSPTLASTAKQITLHAIVDDIPGSSKSGTRFSAKVGSDTILVFGPQTALRYGDTITIRTTLEKPQPFDTNFGKSFAYDEYLANQGVYLIAYAKEITVTGHNPPSKILELLFKFKSKLTNIINHYLGQEEAQLAGGIVLGNKQSFTDELRNALSITGTSHIVALSGFNVSLLAMAVTFLLRRLGKRTQEIGGVLIIVLFVIMTGAQITAIRAGIMGSLILIAGLLGRDYIFVRALLLAGVGMTLFHPRIMYDLSFQLSFLATIGVVVLAPKLTFIRTPVKWITEAIQLTLAASVMVIPIIAYKIGVFSLVSFPINILIAPLVPLVMFLTLPVFILGWIGTIFVLPFAYILSLATKVLLFIIKTAALIPFAALPVTIPFWIVGLYYVPLFWYLCREKRANKQ